MPFITFYTICRTVKTEMMLASRRLQIGTDEGDYLAHKPDAERQLRYKKIARFLSGYATTQVLKVPDLDQIAPLPPAKLPKWDGKIEF